MASLLANHLPPTEVGSFRVFLSTNSRAANNLKTYLYSVVAVRPPMGLKDKDLNIDSLSITARYYSQTCSRLEAC